MGKSTRSVQRNRMSQKKLDSLIIKKDAIFIEKEHVNPHPILASHQPYDTLNPEETFKVFIVKIQEMLLKYEADYSRLNALENEIQDILHFVEMSTDKNANTGYKLYKQLCELRRERRALKSEMELLQPVYNMFKNTGMLAKLMQAQGECHDIKQIIENRVYSVRTDALEEYF